MCICWVQRKKSVLKGINLKVSRGEVVAIVGSSGAGKTTMVNLLPRFYDTTSGEILIGGVEIREMKVHDLRESHRPCDSRRFLFNESIRENVLAGHVVNWSAPLRLALAVNRAVNAAHAGDFVSRMPQKLDTIVGERGSQLSGGERQRISIARALF